MEAGTKASVLDRCLQAWLAAPGFGGPRRRRDLRVPGRTYIERREREEAEEARGGGGERPGRPRPEELLALPNLPSPPGRLRLRFREPSRASAPARRPLRAPRRCPRAGVPAVPAALPAPLGSSAHRRAACRGGGTETRTTVSVLGPADEAAPRWVPTFGFLRLRVSREALPTRERSGVAEGRGVALRECGWATSRKLLSPRPRSFSRCPVGGLGGPQASNDLSGFGPWHRRAEKYVLLWVCAAPLGDSGRDPLASVSPFDPPTHLERALPHD